MPSCRAPSRVQTEARCRLRSLHDHGTWRRFAASPPPSANPKRPDLGSNCSLKALRAPKFKAFDFFDRATGAATSAKTLDTGTKTYARRSRQIFSTLKGYLDESASFDGHLRKSFRFRSSEIQRRRMELAIPNGTTAEQMNEINRARADAESIGIESR